MSTQATEFEALFREHYGAVYRYAARRVEPAAVGDLAAEVFLVAWRRREEIEGDPLPWLLGVARRVCANHLRSRGRRSAVGERLAREPALEAGEPVDAVLLDEGAPAGDRVPHIADGELRAALESLRPGDRELLTLIAWEGLDNHDAAHLLGCSPRTLAVRLHRARRRLAVALVAQRTRSADGAARREDAARTEGVLGNETC